MFENDSEIQQNGKKIPLDTGSTLSVLPVDNKRTKKWKFKYQNTDTKT